MRKRDFFKKKTVKEFPDPKRLNGIVHSDEKTFIVNTIAILNHKVFYTVYITEFTTLFKMDAYSLL